MTRQEQLIIILLILAGLLGTGILYHRKFAEPSVTPKIVKAEGRIKKEDNPQELLVDVKGACWRPGVYSLKQGARVKDVLKIASPREDANLDGINLARLLRDGERIFIPSNRREGPAKNIREAVQEDGISDEVKININDATREELEKLPQIGPRLADYIISYREAHGPFNNIEDLKKVERIGEETLKKIKDLITVDE